ncbi:MAG: DNA polymerase III subunit delta' [Candidatus Pacebacteria bacterium]|nr:DNA polymerase III subunit delta' [Candidatus Paceibacterota bacterium]
MIYPWQNTEWQLLNNQREHQRLPHAILLCGANGLGKSEFASSLAVSLLCESPQSNGESCGNCNSCRLTEAGTHPDLTYLAPEDESKVIKVDEIRALCTEFFLTSQFAGYKIAIINHADQMNINASNSLLKTLEEPNDQSILILVTSKPHRLPITIRSRCQSISFQVPDTQQASQWLSQNVSGDVSQLLNISHGAPLRAQHFADSDLPEQRKGLMEALLAVARNQPVIEHAQKLSKWPSHSLLGWAYDWVSDLLKLIHYGQNCNLVNQDYRKELIELSLKLQSVLLYQLLDQIIKFRKVQSIPLNTQMLWEDLLISWEQLLKRA